MDENVKRNFLEVFLREWEMRVEDKGEKRKDKRCGAEGDLRREPFDEGVKTGEVRVFADSEGPLIGLVVADQEDCGWLLVPVSDFTVPATEQEILVGKRVYQLWNSFSAPKDFAARSWVVETVPAEDLRDVAAALKAVLAEEPLREDLAALTGLPITATDDPRLEYEKEFMAAGRMKRRDEIPAAATNRVRWWRYAFAAAACLVVLLGVSVVIIGEQAREEPWDEGHAPAVCGGAVLCCSEPTHEYCAEASCCSREVGFEGRKYKALPGVVEDRPASCAPMAKSFEPDAFARERYAEYAENEFVETKVQPLSTFGLDVDTASYATMRRYLAEMKRLPPRDSVRLEEYVNYFKYSYPEPKGDVPVTVDCELADCPWNKAHKLLRVGLQAKNVKKDKLPPSNLVFLLDRSGSMNANGGFDTLVKSMRLLVGQLRAEDSVAIVTYASGTEVTLEATKCSEEGKAKILGVIDSLRAGGGTSGGEGIQLAYREAKRNFDRRSNNRVILMTDGDFNIGVQSTQELVRLIEKQRESGVFLSVFGVGYGNYRDEMMKKLANAGNGNYAFIDSILEAKKVFMTEFSGSMYTVAKDVKLQLEFNPAQTSAYRLLGYESRRLAARDFNDDKKDSGEMGAGHNMTAFYELIPAGVKSDVVKVDPLKYQKTTAVESAELLTVKLRYKEPGGEKSRLVEIPVVAADVTRREGPSADFRFASAVAEFALVMEDSKFKAQASIKDLVERARGAKGEDTSGYRAEFIRLVEMAELLSK